MVYQGMPNHVVDYWANLGHPLPTHVNPADFALDVISDGAEKFVLAWSDAQQSGATARYAMQSTPQASESSSNSKYTPRRMPSFLGQAFVFLRRAMLLQFKAWKSFLIDILLVLLGGTFLGAIYMNVSLNKLQPMNTLASLVVGITTMLSALRVFGTNRAVFWREAASGINRPSYFLAENLAHLPQLLISPLVMLCSFYTLTSPRAPVALYYGVFVLVNLCVSGLSYIISIVINPRNTQMTAVVVALISSMLV